MNQQQGHSTTASLDNGSGGVRRGLPRWCSAVAVCAVFSLAGCGAAGGSAASDESSTSSVQRVAVHALGRLEPQGTVLKVSPTSGNEGSTLAELLVAEGDDVAAGQVLARLDTAPRRHAALQESQARWAAANSRLQQILAGSKQGDIDKARSAVLFAEQELQSKLRDWTRAQELRQKQTLSMADFDAAQLAWQRATQNLEQARAMLTAVSEVREVDVQAQEAEIAVAAAAIVTAQTQLAAAELRAPQSGRILKIHAHQGELIGSQGVLEMGRVERMQAVAEVYEGDLPLVYVGQPAQIALDSIPGSMAGVVVEIGHLVGRKAVLTNDPVSDTDARVVEVRIDLLPPMIPALQRLSNARVQVQLSLNRLNDEPVDRRPSPASSPAAPSSQVVLPEANPAVLVSPTAVIPMTIPSPSGPGSTEDE
jgi:HlyD family secretion protein